VTAGIKWMSLLAGQQHSVLGFGPALTGEHPADALTGYRRRL
jgi:hypothetical protein